MSWLAEQLEEDGVFAMWSNEPSEQSFMDDLKTLFKTVRCETVSFYNPLQNAEASNTVYIAQDNHLHD